jgi:hypothetical protein
MNGVVVTATIQPSIHAVRGLRIGAQGARVAQDLELLSIPGVYPPIPDDDGTAPRASATAPEAT